MSKEYENISENYINAIEAASKLNLYLKVVTSTKSFESYNSFFNIFSDSDEPCRRIVVLTPYKELEEVEDRDPSKPIEKYEIIDGSMWIKEYPLLYSPNKIKLEDIYISKDSYERLSKL